MEFICQPFFYNSKDLSCIEGNHSFLELLKAQDQVSYLRSLYKDNVELFFDVVDECLLRGFYFNKSFVNSNLFSNFKAKSNEVILVDNSEENYKNIDFVKLGLGSLVERFRIKNDMFFHMIPLDGFLCLNNLVSLESIKKEFLLNSFKIVNSKDVNNRIESLDVNISEDRLNVFDYFDEKKFLFLKRFCDKNDICYLDELTPDIINLLKNDYGVGKGKMNDFYNRVHELEKSFVYIGEKYDKDLKVVDIMLDFFFNNSFKSYCDDVNINYSGFFNEIYTRDAPVLNTLDERFNDLKNSIEESYIDNNSEKIKSNILAIQEHRYFPILKDFPLFFINAGESEVSLESALDKFMSVRQLKRIFDAVDDYKSFKEKIEDVLNNLKERERLILKYRIKGMSLQEIGHLLGITRERVRQIEKAVLLKKLNTIEMVKYLNSILDYYLKEKEFMIFRDLYIKLNLNSEVESYLLEHYIGLSDDYFFDSSVDLVTSIKLHSLITGKIYKLTKKMIISKEEVKQFSEVYQIDIEVIELYLKSYDYRETKNCYFISKGLSLSQKISYIFKNHFLDNSLQLNQKGYLILKNYLIDYFDEKNISNRRSLIERVRAGENIILVGRITFKYHDPDKFSNSFIIEIEQILNTILKESEMVTSMFIFEKESKIMERYNITTHQHLYSLIQYYLSEEFLIGRGNTFEIKLNKYEGESKTSSELLYGYLNKNNGIALSEEILKKYSWQSYKLSQLVSKDTNLINLQNKTIVHIDYFQLKEDDISNLVSIVNKELEKGYIITRKLFNDLIFEDEYERFFTKHKIEDEYIFEQLLKIYVPNLLGHSNFLYLSDSPYTSIIHVIADKFRGVTLREDIVSFIEDAMYGDSTVYFFIRDLLSGGYFLPYSSTEFINTKDLNFTIGVRNSLTKYLSNQIGFRKYLTLKDVHGFTRKVKKISKYDWTPHLLFEFADKCGYSKLPSSNDMRLNKLFIGVKDIEVSSFEELLKYVLDNEYDGELIIEDVLKFLIKKKLHNNPVELPIELKNGRFFYENKSGFLMRR